MRLRQLQLTLAVSATKREMKELRQYMDEVSQFFLHHTIVEFARHLFVKVTNNRDNNWGKYHEHSNNKSTDLEQPRHDERREIKSFIH